jgi:hypothetical protein
MPIQCEPLERDPNEGLCLRCGEPLEEGDLRRREVMHLECRIRVAFGSVAHQEKRCSCFVPGSMEGDDPSLSKRENARLAAGYYEAHEDKE